VQGPADSTVTTGRAEGLDEVLEAERYQTRTVNGDWTEKGGGRAMASWLRLKTVELFQPDLVVCQNDIMAMGARRVLRQQRPEWARVPFLGCDGLPKSGQQQVEAKHLAATVVIPSNTGPALDLVAKWVQDREPLPAEVLLSPSSFPPESRLGATMPVTEAPRSAAPAS
jgi:ABC-type sugar transport system substrate-binding protein